MIFIREPEIVEAYEQGDYFHCSQVQDIGPTLALNQQLREHDDTKGWTHDRTMKHLASVPPIVFDIARQTEPEIFKDKRAFDRWLNRPENRQYKVSHDAAPVRGEGLQVIVR